MMERNEKEKAEELYLKIGQLLPNYTASEVANALTHGLGIVLGHQEEKDVEKLIEGIVLSLKHSEKSFREYKKMNPCMHG